ncbi:hypothetical protein ACYOEI_15490 [Singulisphaera rosea]
MGLGRTRRFNLLDGMVMVAAIGLSLSWWQMFQASMRPRPSPNGPISTSYPLTIRYLGASAPFLVTPTLALFFLRIVGSRPRYHDLVRSPGFLACAAAVLGLAMTGISILLNELGRMYTSGRPPLAVFYLTMRTVNYPAPVIAGAWLALGLMGEWRGRLFQDWIETLGTLVGLVWLVLYMASQINI